MATATPAISDPLPTAPAVIAEGAASVGGLEQVFTELYERVNPSAVTIQVMANAERSREIPEVRGFPFELQPPPGTPQQQPRGGLDADQSGVLVGRIAADSPADEAGLRGSDTTATISGQEVAIGGDIITAVYGTAVASVEELRAQLQEAGADGSVSLTILRDGEQLEQSVELGGGSSE